MVESWLQGFLGAAKWISQPSTVGHRDPKESAEIVCVGYHPLSQPFVGLLEADTRPYFFVFQQGNRREPRGMSALAAGTCSEAVSKSPIWFTPSSPLREASRSLYTSVRTYIYKPFTYMGLYFFRVAGQEGLSTGYDSQV